MKNLVRSILFPVLVLLMACGGGGDDGGGGGIVGGSGGTANLAVTLMPDQPNPGALDVSMIQAPGSGGANVIVVQVDATGISNLFGTSFDVTFDPSAVTFLDTSPGTALETGGYAVAYQSAVSSPGRMVFGASRTGGAPGVNVSSSTPLVYLTFQVTQAGDHGLTFDNSVLLDTQAPPQSIPGLAWFGGTLVAN